MYKNIKHNGTRFIGDRHGSLEIIKLVNRTKDGNSYYLCKCDCGNELITRYSSLKNGNTKSCGCFAKKVSSDRLKKPSGVRSFNCTYYKYEYRAKGRGLIFDISRDRFRELTSSNCHYCGHAPSSLIDKKKMKNGIYLYNGLDRVDNTKGYIEGNVVTCCEQCNRMKLDYTLDEFEEQIIKIYTNYILKNTKNEL